MKIRFLAIFSLFLGVSFFSPVYSGPMDWLTGYFCCLTTPVREVDFRPKFSDGFASVCNATEQGLAMYDAFGNLMVNKSGYTLHIKINSQVFELFNDSILILDRDLDIFHLSVRASFRAEDSLLPDPAVRVSRSDLKEINRSKPKRVYLYLEDEDKIAPRITFRLSYK